MSEWINTKNKLPQDGTLVFVHYMTKKGERHYGIAHCHYDEGYKNTRWILGEGVGFSLKNVLYWLPIPKFPKQENDNEH